MKKIFILIMIFISIPLFAQNWKRNYDFEQELKKWDLHLQVWVLENATVNFKDDWSKNWYQVREQMAGLFYVLMVEKIYYIDYAIYSWIENENSNWDIHMDKPWLKNYSLAIKSEDRRKMLDLIIQTQQFKWEEKNNLYLKPKINPQQQKAIDEQLKLENIAPSLKK